MMTSIEKDPLSTKSPRNKYLELNKAKLIYLVVSTFPHKVRA